jgi:hypothetical protein
MSTKRIFRPAYVIDELGELGRTPDGAISNIGGTDSPTFTVGGFPVVVDTGVGPSNANLQSVYDLSVTGNTNLSTGKNWSINALNGNKLIVDAATGNVTINGLINGVNLGLLNAHVDGAVTPAKHTASQVSADTSTMVNIVGASVQQALESIDGQLGVLAVGNAAGYEYIKAIPATVWTIVHSNNTKRVQVQIWDESDNMVFADTVSIVDSNTVRVVFSTAQAGRAILMLF